MPTVSSTAIASLDYDEDSETLTVTFHDGNRYDLPKFPQIEYERFLNADSIGRYWNANVRGKY